MANAVDNDKYKGEYWWIIKGDEFTQMLGAANEQKFTSATFTMTSLNWCIDVYPNGHKDNNAGSFKVFLKLLSLPPKGTKVIVCRRIYCQETESSYTCMASYEKYGVWGWPDYTLSLDECKTLQQLSLMVQVKLVRVINQFNGQNTVTYSYLNELNKIPKRQLFEWNIDEQLINKMKNSYCGKTFESPIYDDMWCLKISPNGKSATREDSFDVYLQICIPEMSVEWKLNCKQFEINKDYKNMFNFNTKSDSRNWGDNTLSFTKFKNCQLNSLQFEIDINIIHMFDDYQNRLSATKMRKYFKQPEFKFKYLENNSLDDKLYKRGKFNKAWKERFFTVNRAEQTIEYYSSSDDRKQQKNIGGIIDLSAVSRIEVIANQDISMNSFSDHPGIHYNEEAKSDKQYTFQLITEKRTYVFAAYSKELLLKWLIYLESCLYRHIIQEGWMEMATLKAKSHEFKFELRYFTLNKFQQIKYYDFDETQQKKYNQSYSNGTIDCKFIERVNIHPNPPRNCKFYLFEMHTKSKSKSKSYIFGAITQIDRSDWMEFINIIKAKDWKYQLEEIEQNDYDEKKIYDDNDQLAIRTYQDLIDISETEFQKNKNNAFVKRQYNEYITYTKFCVLSGKKEYDFDSDWLWKEYVTSGYKKNQPHEARQCDFLARRIVAEPQGIVGQGFIKWANSCIYNKGSEFKSHILKKIDTDFDQMRKERRIDNLIHTANDKLASYSENDVIFKKLISFAMYCSLQQLHFHVPDSFCIGSERFDDTDYKKKKRLFDIDNKCHDWEYKKLLHTIHHVVVFPEGVIGKKFKIWCQVMQKHQNSSGFEKIRNEYNQMKAADERKTQVEEKKRRDEYNKIKANQNEETQNKINKSKVKSNKQIAKNNESSSSSSNSRDVYPALYCTHAPCGFGHFAKECGKCGKRMITLKRKAYLCTSCGFGHKGKKCIKCGKPVMGRSVQAYLCTGCGFGHKGKKCVKCGAHVWGI